MERQGEWRRRPTATAARTVAGRFHRAAQRKGATVDMKEAQVTSTAAGQHACKTIACAAGHYAVQHDIDEGKEPLQGELKAWGTGAALMAQDLQMENDEHIIGWADANPELWGNDHGWEMFYEENAYNFEGPTLELADIARHWDEVAERVEKNEQAKAAQA